eukprot:1160405-Amphidinium_carterae.1
MRKSWQATPQGVSISVCFTRASTAESGFEMRVLMQLVCCGALSIGPVIPHDISCYTFVGELYLLLQSHTHTPLHSLRKNKNQRARAKAFLSGSWRCCSTLHAFMHLERTTSSAELCLQSGSLVTVLQKPFHCGFQRRLGFQSYCGR